MRIILLTLAALLVLISAPAAGAQEQTEVSAPAFACTAEREGQLSCQVNRVCECVFRPAEAAKGLPGRFGWDCGILRPQCEITPAEGGEFWLPYGYLPDAIVVDDRGNPIRRRDFREGDQKRNDRSNRN